MKKPPVVVKSDDALAATISELKRASQVEQFRDIVNQLNANLTRLDKAPFEALSPEQAAFLKDKVGLTAEELQDIDSTSFRTADAYYLESCSLFHDAALSLESASLTQAEQAKLCFDWTMRRVLLHEQGDEALPPAFILRRGYGSAVDRGTVFLELLRQLDIPGFFVAPSEPGATKSLLIGSAADGTIQLYDPRLGDFLADGKDAQATFPEIVKRYPDAAKRSWQEFSESLRVRATCPTLALAPRMRYLDKMLAGSTTLHLYCDVPKLLDQAKWAEHESHFWHDPPRTLRMFLPENEGGQDKSNRFKKYQAHLLPQAEIELNLHRLQAFISNPAMQVDLKNRTVDLLTKYYLQPEEMVLRGQYDKSIQRLSRIRPALGDIEFVPTEELRSSIEHWRESATKAYLAQVRKDAKADELMNALWNGDDFFVSLLDVTSGAPLKSFSNRSGKAEAPKDDGSRALSRIMLTACKNALSEQVDYLMAASWQEKASRCQAILVAARRANKELGFAEKTTRDAWLNTKGTWQRDYLERHNLGPEYLLARLQIIRDLTKQGNPDFAVALWEELHLDLHQYLAARDAFAQALSHTAGTVEAQREWGTMLEEIETLEKEGVIPKELTELAPELTPINARRVELLQRDWQPDGPIAAWKDRLRIHSTPP